MDFPPFRLSGAVYGVLLNQRSALTALGTAVDAPPHKGAPRAPVLYVKPRNTLNSHGADIVLPADADELEIGACLGVVIGHSVAHVPEAEAMDCVAGYLIVNDVSVPHLPYYRPSYRFKARDGFCPLGPRVIAASAVNHPGSLGIRVYVDGELRQSASTADLIRPIPKLLADVTEFMTLATGDIVALGAAANAPRVRAGQRVAIEIDGIGRLENNIVAEAE